MDPSLVREVVGSAHPFKVLLQAFLVLRLETCYVKYWHGGSPFVGRLLLMLSRPLMVESAQRRHLGQLRELLEKIHEEAEQLLVKQELYPSYGWLGQDMSDPEYIGYAMWDLSPPFEHDWEGLQPGGTVTYEPTERDEVLLRNGADFIGSMEFARRSLGMALCHAAAATPKSHIYENQEFWHEYATTLQWLNIACDRIRDYFLVARFERAKKKYKKNKERGRRYAEPFKIPLEGAPDNIRELLNELSRIAPELEDHRTVRDGIVHKLATQAAHSSITMLREQRELAKLAKRGEKISVENWTHDDLQSNLASIPDDTLAPQKENMKLWYTRLVKAGSLVFEFEYWTRQQTG
jgi:hypothetical protein